MTGLILNGKAVCCMHMGHFDEAETLLLEALNKASCLFSFIGKQVFDAIPLYMSKMLDREFCATM